MKALGLLLWVVIFVAVSETIEHAGKIQVVEDNIVKRHVQKRDGVHEPLDLSDGSSEKLKKELELLKVIGDPDFDEKRHFQKKHFQKKHFQKKHVQKKHFQKKHFQKKHFQKKHFQKKHFQKKHFQKKHFQKKHFQKKHSLFDFHTRYIPDEEEKEYDQGWNIDERRREERRYIDKGKAARDIDGREAAGYIDKHKEAREADEAGYIDKTARDVDDQRRYIEKSARQNQKKHVQRDADRADMQSGIQSRHIQGKTPDRIEQTRHVQRKSINSNNNNDKRHVQKRSLKDSSKRQKWGGHRYRPNSRAQKRVYKEEEPDVTDLKQYLTQLNGSFEPDSGSKGMEDFLGSDGVSDEDDDYFYGDIGEDSRDEGDMSHYHYTSRPEPDNYQY